MSQLDLAMRAGFSARHVSFIETGRTQPSRQALLVLAETLDVPLRERNRLLEAGGYAHVYQNRDVLPRGRSVRTVLEEHHGHTLSVPIRRSIFVPLACLLRY
jgi:transcriptional regulator with XRE-family HTH domain